MVAAKNSKLLLWLRILQERKNSGKMNHLITYITLKRRRLRNLQFLLLQNEASSQSYDRIRTNHKRSCRRYLRNSGWFSNVWENYCDKRFKTIEFQKIHSPMYLVLFAMIYNANTFVQLQFGQKKGLEFVCTAWVVKTITKLNQS